MVQRPDSAPSEVEPLPELAEQETSFVNQVADSDTAERRLQTPIAWAQVYDNSEKNNIAKGINFMNRAAFDPATEIIEEIKESSPVRDHACSEDSNSGKVFRRNSATSVTSKQSCTNSLGSINALSPQAYIPYNVARKNISRVINDMKIMREDHRKALGEVNCIYKEIENETQVSGW